MAKKKSKKVYENERLIRQLPDDIVLSSILSCLTIKELSRTRLVSRHWNRIYHHISVLDFDKSCSKQNIITKQLSKLSWEEQLFERTSCSFVDWVNHVVAKHMGSTIDQFKVNFELNNRYQSHIDKWLVWAFSKHVKILELDLASIYFRRGSENNRYLLDKPLINKVNVKPNLTCLCLKGVNVTTQAVEHLLESCCSTLENLCIEQSVHLTSIRMRNSVEMKALKYLKVFWCGDLDTIDIFAPKLLSFTYDESKELKLLRIGKVSSLSWVSIQMKRVDHLVNALTSLSNCISQLEYLKLRWSLYPNIKMVYNRPPVLANLKHLELCVSGSGSRTLRGWIPLIKACPLLQKLTLQLHCWPLPYDVHINRDKHRLWFLKTLEIIGFVGGNVDLDVANFVLENGVALQEVIIQPRSSIDQPDKPDCNVLRRISHLKIPRGVKLSLK